MIQNGLKPVHPDPRDYSFNATFGSISPIELPPEFDVDAGFPVLDQNADGLPFGCTGYSQADLCQDQDKVDFIEKDIYDKTLIREGYPGDYTRGCDIRTSLQIVVDYFGRGGYYRIQQINGSWFEGIRSAIWMNRNERRAVSIGTPWFLEMSMVGPSGIMPDVFHGDPMQQSWHNWVISGWVIKNGKTYLKAKPWQGERFGDKGWCYFSPKAINYLLSIPYTGAFTVSKADPDSIKTVSDLKLGILSKILMLIGDWLRENRKKFGAWRDRWYHTGTSQPRLTSFLIQTRARGQSRPVPCAD